MVIVTDGEDFSGHLEGVNKQAKDLGLSIFTLGIGTPEGAPIPLYTDEGVQHGHQKDEKGAVVITGYMNSCSVHSQQKREPSLSRLLKMTLISELLLPGYRGLKKRSLLTHR